MEDIIKNVQIVLLGIFNSGIVLRMIKTLIDAQADEDKNTKKIFINYIKILAIGNSLGTLIPVVVEYYR